jgi:hypothetical protein
MKVRLSILGGLTVVVAELDSDSQTITTPSPHELPSLASILCGPGQDIHADCAVFVVLIPLTRLVST